MQKEIILYLSRKVIEDIRAGIFLDDDTAKRLNEFPLIDALRENVQERDIFALMEMAQINSAKIGGLALNQCEYTQEQDFPGLCEKAKTTILKNRDLAISLLRKFDTQEYVKSFFLGEWQRTITDNDYDIGMPLIWRLLDNTELDVSIHRQIREFVVKNYRKFIDDTSQWYGGPDTVLDAVKKRLSDPEFPRTKDWIYLYVARGSTDRKGAEDLIASYMRSNDTLIAEVVSELCHSPA